MGNKRNRNKSTTQSTLQKPKKIRHFLLGWKFLVAIAGFLATVSGILSLLPRPSVTASDFLVVNEPFSAPFVITNEGYLPIHDVTFRCAIRHYKGANGGNIEVYKGGGITPSGFVLSEMPPGEKATVGCPFPFKGWEPVISADFDFVVVYRPDFLPWKQEKRFRFGTVKGGDGLLRWYPRSMSEQ